VIYKNDLKYRESRGLNENKIDWNQNNIKHLFNIDHDSKEYRVAESKTSNYVDLDMTMTKLNKIPSFIRNNVFVNLEHLFLSNNILTGSIDLRFLRNLKMIDIDNNEIVELFLPQSIVEISASHNKLNSFKCDYPNLKRIKISNNTLNDLDIKMCDKLETLEANDNKLNDVDFSSFRFLKRLIVYTNPIKTIKFPPECMYVDVSETSIDKIEDIGKTEHLVLNHCKLIRQLPSSDTVKTLELIDTPVSKLMFYKNFELILLQLNLTDSISSKYKKCGGNIQIRKNKFLVISRGIDIRDE